MYIPKNRIKTNLYTSGGEYMIKKTNKEYIGFYHTLYTGKAYTGKTQNDKPIQELIVLKNIEEEIFKLTAEDQIFQQYAENWDEEVIPGQFQNMTDIRIYNNITETDISKTALTPQQSYPNPTEEDYSLGVFTRYFAVKTNQDIYLELDEKTYKKLIKKDSNWNWPLYECFSIQWTLVGQAVRVAQINKNQILIAEQRLKRLGFDVFLRKNYLKFYR